MLSLSSIVSMKVFPLTVNTITGEAGGRASEQRRADIRGHPAASGPTTEAPPHREVHRGLILGYRGGLIPDAEQPAPDRPARDHLRGLHEEERLTTRHTSGDSARRQSAPPTAAS